MRSFFIGSLFLLILTSCSDVNQGRNGDEVLKEKYPVQNPAIRKENTAAARIDSLKILFNNALVALDSLTGVKNGLGKEDPALSNEIRQQKEVADRLLREMETITSP